MRSDDVLRIRRGRPARLERRIDAASATPATRRDARRPRAAGAAA